jgi:hypothetical protein
MPSILVSTHMRAGRQALLSGAQIGRGKGEEGEGPGKANGTNGTNGQHFLVPSREGEVERKVLVNIPSRLARKFFFRGRPSSGNDAPSSSAASTAETRVVHLREALIIHL